MFSRHGIAQTSLALLIWLNENIPFNYPFKLSECETCTIYLTKAVISSFLIATFALSNGVLSCSF